LDDVIVGVIDLGFGLPAAQREPQRAQGQYSFHNQAIRFSAKSFGRIRSARNPSGELSHSRAEHGWTERKPKRKQMPKVISKLRNKRRLGCSASLD
jgi:hypothetical protein